MAIGLNVMRIEIIVALRWATALASVLAVSACGSPYYTADPIEAWVVDADTGQPIEGAVVTANWQLVGFTLDTGGSKNGQLAVMETMTDRNGRFFFPGFTKVNLSLRELREEDPQILIFKPGYRYLGGGNHYPVGQAYPGARRSSELNGKTLSMRKADPDPMKQANDLMGMTTVLSNIENSGDADKVPKMINALACERQRLKLIDQKILLSVPGAHSDAGRQCAK